MAEIGREKTLTPRQLRAIDALLSAKSLGDAAKSAGVAESTLRRWRKLPHFRAATLAAEGEALSDLARRLIAGNVDALDIVTGLMKDAESEPVRIRAAELWLTLGVKLFEVRTLEERLARLEGAWRQLDGQTGFYHTLDET